MIVESISLPKLEFIFIMTCWMLFALGFLLRKRPPRHERTKRDLHSIAGIVLVGLGYACIWFIRRPQFSPFLNSVAWLELIPAIFIVLSGAGSVWLVLAAIRKLGVQWSPVARIVKDHRLVMDGPYAYVRHPIYSGMLGLLFATGVAVSTWPSVLVAGALGWYGTRMRIEREEKLLAEEFGSAFHDYQRRVPALLPRIQRTTGV
jgi:protein-S-isoprenylcysteine O-methyltransferase Ste14